MKSIIEKFYTSFSQLDAEGMLECYHDNITFQDPAFGVLKGDKAKNMWRMLCHNAKKGGDFNITFSAIEYTDNKGEAYWEAHYVFSKTGRKIHNKINATFEFKDNKIITNQDHFDLHKWSKQAFGLKGAILGKTAFFKRKLNAQTNLLLSRFEENLKN